MMLASEVPIGGELAQIAYIRLSVFFVKHAEWDIKAPPFETYSTIFES
jgi:hypothetical protein